MEDLPPVDSVGKLFACQLPVHYCGALYLEFQSDTSRCYN